MKVTGTRGKYLKNPFRWAACPSFTSHSFTCFPRLSLRSTATTTSPRKCPACGGTWRRPTPTTSSPTPAPRTRRSRTPTETWRRGWPSNSPPTDPIFTSWLKNKESKSMWLFRVFLSDNFRTQPITHVASQSQRQTWTINCTHLTWFTILTQICRSVCIYYSSHKAVFHFWSTFHFSSCWCHIIYSQVWSDSNVYYQALAPEETSWFIYIWLKLIVDCLLLPLVLLSLFIFPQAYTYVELHALFWKVD